MNTIHEMLLPDLNDLKIAERRAEAVAWHRAHEATAASRSEHTWSVSGLLRLPALRHSGQATKAI
jgi:hypothetical protein